VDKAVRIRCLLFDGSFGDAEVLGADKDTDLALLQLHVEGTESFPHATLGESAALREGQFVMAMGAPWGLSRSVSLGIVSCTTRFLSSEIGMYNLWIQTDASINPGNSGGPLVDTEGRVVGINTRGTFFGGDLAFAIPADVVRRVVPKLREHGRVPRAWTGLRLQPLKDFERDIFFPGKRGAPVASVDDGSPAEAAGLRTGDLLLAVEGRSTDAVSREDLPAIHRLLADLPPGEPAALTVLRDEEERTLELVPRTKGKVEGEDFDAEAWNMTVKAINEFSTPILHYYRPGGVFVQGVKYPGNAAEAGIRPYDIVLAIDGEAVEGVASFRAAYEKATGETEERKVLLKLLRSGLPHYILLDFATEYETF
jgi:serine protease Do